MSKDAFLIDIVYTQIALVQINIGINVVSVERSAKGYLSLSELRQLKTANVLLKTDRIGAYDTELVFLLFLLNVVIFLRFK